MLDKDKLHMVFYIGTKDNAYTKTSSDLLQIVEDINTSIPTDGSVQKYFIVDKNSNDIKVECINPIYIFLTK